MRSTERIPESSNDPIGTLIAGEQKIAWRVKDGLFTNFRRNGGPLKGWQALQRTLAASKVFGRLEIAP